MNRRQWLAGGLAAAGSACTQRKPKPWPRKEPVFVRRAPSYDWELESRVRDAVVGAGIPVRGKRILLKPNLVEFSLSWPINTHPWFVSAVARVLLSLGAAEVRIGEGPGHRRDTLTLAEEAGYFESIEDFEKIFIDLNRDEVERVGELGEWGPLWAPRSLLAADLIISLPKLKTHHWAGVTLSMKNLFGTVPGSLYGWPKNVLHHYGIDASIVKLAGIWAPKTAAIVDGIVGMEGNGPIQGEPRDACVIVAGTNLPAVDATCCRLMGIDPLRVRSLEMAQHLGPVDAAWIEQRGEDPAKMRQNFALMPMWSFLRAPGG